jgi:ech hydrogenase subunit A
LFPHYLASQFLFPILAALFFLLNKNSHLRRFAVFFVGAVLLLSAAWVLALGQGIYRPSGTFSTLLGYFLTWGNGALLLGFSYVGWRWGYRWLTGLALAQVTLLGGLLTLPGGQSGSGAFVLDHLSGLMLFLTDGVGALLLICVAALPEAAKPRRSAKERNSSLIFVAALLLLGAIHGAVLSNQLLWLLFFCQTATICATALIVQERTKPALRSAWSFLQVTSVAGAAVLAGITFLPESARALSITDLLQFKDAALLTPTLTCLVVAGVVYSGQFPFQRVLTASLLIPAPVGALLHSCTVICIGAYLFLRFSPLFINTWLSSIAAVIGAFSFAAGAILAAMQHERKRFLAYSTTSVMGLVLTLACLPELQAIYAAILLVLWHGVSKALLFISSRDRSISVVGKRITLFGVASMLLPPFGLPIAQWTALESSGRNPVAMGLIIAGMVFLFVAWTLFADSQLRLPSEMPAGGEKWRKYWPQWLLVGGITGLSVFSVPFAKAVVSPILPENYSRFDDIAQGNAGAFRIQEFSGINPIWAFAAIGATVGVCWIILRICARTEIQTEVDLTESVDESADELVTKGAPMPEMPPVDSVVGETDAEVPPIEPNDETQAAEAPLDIPPEIITAEDKSRQTIITPRCAVFAMFPDERRTELYATMIAGGLVILMFEVVIR